MKTLALTLALLALPACLTIQNTAGEGNSTLDKNAMMGDKAIDAKVDVDKSKVGGEKAEPKKPADDAPPPKPPTD